MQYHIHLPGKFTTLDHGMEQGKNSDMIKHKTLRARPGDHTRKLSE
jgi:hypothetical protein